MKRHFLFTLSAGRTGTLSLARCLEQNLPGAEVRHEMLGAENFGVDTPEISHLKQFNTSGNNDHVQRFWKTKFARVMRGPTPIYAETSHILMKAGLCENLEQLRASGHVHLLVLKRDVVKTIMSYRRRADFLNRGNMWMWYLDPNYPRHIISPGAFENKGVEGVCLWYLLEIAARAEYYRLLLADRDWISFHDFETHQFGDRASIRGLLIQLGVDVPEERIVLSPAQNQSRFEIDIPDEHAEYVSELVSRNWVDPADAARGYFGAGKRLGAVNTLPSWSFSAQSGSWGGQSGWGK